MSWRELCSFFYQLYRERQKEKRNIAISNYHWNPLGHQKMRHASRYTLTLTDSRMHLEFYIAKLKSERKKERKQRLLSAICQNELTKFERNVINCMSMLSSSLRCIIFKYYTWSPKLPKFFADSKKCTAIEYVDVGFFYFRFHIARVSSTTYTMNLLLKHFEFIENCVCFGNWYTSPRPFDVYVCFLSSRPREHRYTRKLLEQKKYF